MDDADAIPAPSVVREKPWVRRQWRSMKCQNRPIQFFMDHPGADRRTGLAGFPSPTNLLRGVAAATFRPGAANTAIRVTSSERAQSGGIIVTEGTVRIEDNRFSSEDAMEPSPWMQNVISLAISLAFGLVTVVLSVVVLKGIDHFLYRDIDFVEEIKKGNLPAALFYCVLLTFVAVIVATSIS